MLTFVACLTHCFLRSLHHRFVAWTKPNTTSLMLRMLTDLARSKSELVAENARYASATHHSAPTGETACLYQNGSDAPGASGQARQAPGSKRTSLVQPETLLRWHRQGFQLFWKYKSRTASLTPRISPETVSLIKEMARNNRLWGAERIRGELLKLDIRVCKRTIQKYMRQVRTSRPRGQTWSTFLQAHAQQIWACDASPSD
jgi:putative transposase